MSQPINVGWAPVLPSDTTAPYSLRPSESLVNVAVLSSFTGSEKIPWATHELKQELWRSEHCLLVAKNHKPTFHCAAGLLRFGLFLKRTLSAMWSERFIALVKLCNCNNFIKNEHLVQPDILGELDLVLAVSFCSCVCSLTSFNILCFIIIRKQYWDSDSSLESQPVKAFYEPSHWWSPGMWSIVLCDMNHQDTPPDFVLEDLS